MKLLVESTDIWLREIVLPRQYVKLLVENSVVGIHATVSRKY